MTYSPVKYQIRKKHKLVQNYAWRCWESTFDSNTNQNYIQEKKKIVFSVKADIISPNEFKLAPNLIRKVCEYAIEIEIDNFIYAEYLDSLSKESNYMFGGDYLFRDNLIDILKNSYYNVEIKRRINPIMLIRFHYFNLVTTKNLFSIHSKIPDSNLVIKFEAKKAFSIKDNKKIKSYYCSFVVTLQYISWVRRKRVVTVYARDYIILDDATDRVRLDFKDSILFLEDEGREVVSTE